MDSTSVTCSLKLRCASTTTTKSFAECDGRISLPSKVMLKSFGMHASICEVPSNSTVMYREFVVCTVPGNCITNAENSTIFYFKSVSTWQEKPTAHVRSAKGFMGYDKQPSFIWINKRDMRATTGGNLLQLQSGRLPGQETTRRATSC